MLLLLGRVAGVSVVAQPHRCGSALACALGSARIAPTTNTWHGFHAPTPPASPRYDLCLAACPPVEVAPATSTDGASSGKPVEHHVPTHRGWMMMGAGLVRVSPALVGSSPLPPARTPSRAPSRSTTPKSDRYCVCVCGWACRDGTWPCATEQAGTAAVACRQTNAVWAAFSAGYVVVTETRRKHSAAKLGRCVGKRTVLCYRVPLCVHHAAYVACSRRVHVTPPSRARWVVWCRDSNPGLVAILRYALRDVASLAVLVAPLAAIVVAFAGFVVWNRGVVIGADRGEACEPIVPCRLR